MTPDPDTNTVKRRGVPCPTCSAITYDIEEHMDWHIRLTGVLSELRAQAKP